jgi:hypothetical protein
MYSALRSPLLSPRSEKSIEKGVAVALTIEIIIYSDLYIEIIMYTEL